jgi:hypothetical protein
MTARPDVDALRKALEASTTGEWTIRQTNNSVEVYLPEQLRTITVAEMGNILRSDGFFITRAHNDLPALLAYIDYLEDLAARTENLLNGLFSLSPDKPELLAELRAVAGGEGE